MKQDKGKATYTQQKLCQKRLLLAKVLPVIFNFLPQALESVSEDVRAAGTVLYQDEPLRPVHSPLTHHLKAKISLEFALGLVEEVTVTWEVCGPSLGMLINLLQNVQTGPKPERKQHKNGGFSFWDSKELSQVLKFNS